MDDIRSLGKDILKDPFQFLVGDLWSCDQTADSTPDFKFQLLTSVLNGEEEMMMFSGFLDFDCLAG